LPSPNENYFVMIILTDNLFRLNEIAYEKNLPVEKALLLPGIALNGYQKGKCFYCFSDICVADDDTCNCEVDHFMPYLLQQHL